MNAGGRPNESRRAELVERSFDDDDAVSDVIGTVLLVGITVLMTAGFSYLILSIDGPEAATFASLAATIGPGLDASWDDGGELTLKHLGGEALSADRTNIIIQYQDGSREVIPATFNSGTLRIGQSWTTAIEGTVGEEISILVTTGTEGVDRVILNAEAMVLDKLNLRTTYPVGYTDTVGTVSSFNGVLSGNDGDAAAILSEESGGGGSSSDPLTGTTTANSGALNSGNALTSNDARATLPLTGNWVEVGGYSQPAGMTQVTQMLISGELSSTVNVPPVVLEEVVGWTGNSKKEIESAEMTGVPGHFYLAAIENSDTVKYSVTSVTGMNLAWSLVDAVCADEAVGGCVEVWKGSGTPINGKVSAWFAEDTDKGAIAVMRYSGVDLNNPIGGNSAAQGPGTGGSQAWSAPSVTGSSQGRFVVALGSHDREGSTWSNPTNVIYSDGESAEIWMSVAEGPASPGSNTAAGSLIGGSDDWHVVALTLNPSVPSLPTATISYSVNGVPGATSQTFNVPAGDQTFTVDVTGDRAWVLADLDNLDIRVTAADATSSAIQVDYIAAKPTVVAELSGFELEVEMAFADVPLGNNERLEIRYRVNNPGDTFTVSVYNGASWRVCPGVMGVTFYTTYTCTLTLPDEFLDGAPRIRFDDVDPAGLDQGALHLEYVRIGTT